MNLKIPKQLPEITVDHLIVAYMGARMPMKIMSSKLGIPEDEIHQRYAKLTQENKRFSDNGMPDLRGFLTNVALHYQQLGIGLEHFAMFLDSLATVDEIRSILTGNADADALAIVEKFIVLRPFVPPSVEEIQSSEN